MTIPALFSFVKTAIILLSVTAFTLAFIYMFASETKKSNE